MWSIQPVPIAMWSEVGPVTKSPSSICCTNISLPNRLKELIDLAPELPVIRDPMSHAYLREENNSILVGPYETSTAHICWNGEPPAWDFESELLPNELDRLLPWLEKAGIRIPLFGESGLKNIVSGAITHTTDGNYLSGPAHGAPNYWMHCGASIGIAQGGGSGKYLAQWMVHGQAEINMREYDPRRFGDWATPDYVKTVAVVDYQHMYTCLPPNHQHNAGRNIRKTGLHDILAAEGAQFGQIFGWERARWYDKNATGAKNTNSSEVYNYKRTNAFPAIREEALAVRERVGLMDLSTFSKFEITGRDAHKFLERVCANKIASKDGGIVLTHLLNKNGFIESELTVTRLGTDSYYALSAAVAQHYDYDQLTWRKLPSEEVTIKDCTDKYGTLVLAGPRARDTLATDLRYGFVQCVLPLVDRQNGKSGGMRRGLAARQLCRRIGLGNSLRHGRYAENLCGLARIGQTAWIGFVWHLCDEFIAH